jgi:hypothetical protein
MDRPQGSFVPAETRFVFLPLLPRDESLGYCLSPSGLGWPPVESLGSTELTEVRVERPGQTL